VIPLGHYLILSGLMFVVGVVGVIVRRNSIVVLMCIELMLNAADLALVALSQAAGNLHGQVAAFFVIIVAAAGAAVGLAIIIAFFRTVRSVETSDAGELKG